MLAFAGWVNRHQQEMIEYLQEENRVLREQLGEKRLRFTDVGDDLLDVLSRSDGAGYRRSLRS
jgi:hypothetical protein